MAPSGVRATGDEEAGDHGGLVQAVVAIQQPRKLIQAVDVLGIGREEAAQHRLCLGVPTEIDEAARPIDFPAQGVGGALRRHQSSFFSRR